MGAFDDVSPIILPDPSDEEKAAEFRKKWGWEPHEQVTLKGAYTAGDQEMVANSTLISGKKGESIYRAGAARTKMMDLLIISWTFMRNGQHVPKTLDAIKRLPANYTTPILEVCDQLSAAMSEEEQEAFFSSANEPISENSIAMKRHQRHS